MSSKRSKAPKGSITVVANAAHAYRAALNRLIEGRATHPNLAGRPVRITPAAVAREARRSRNPLYATHRDILDEINGAANGPTIAANLADTIVRLEAEMAALHATARLHESEKRMLATENLALLHRARIAEEKIASHALSGANRIRA
jgi:hypothetical protein